MKNFIIGIAIVLLTAIFLTFQTDINLFLRQQEYVYDVAEEAAATAAVQTVEGSGMFGETIDFASGYIKFDDAKSASKAMNVVKKALRLDENLVSASSFFSDAMTVELYLFNQDGTYSKFVNGTQTIADGRYTKGTNFSEYCESPYKEKVAALPAEKQIRINYPSTICIINAGKPDFRDNFGFSDTAGDLVKIGYYEYKHYD